MKRQTRRWKWPLLVLSLTAMAVAMAALLASGQGVLHASPDTFTVNSTGDGGDSNTADGVCDDGSGNCTLRAAIQQANATAGTDTIAFNIPGVGPHTIQPTSALPPITDPVIIDGYTQPGASTNSNGPGLGTNALLKIELNGSSAGSGANGLTISAGNSTVRGLVINRFAANGIGLVTNGGNTVEGNFLGTNPAGTADLGNSIHGVVIGSPGNTIGGTSPGARNVISGNNVFGIEISGAGGNHVQGNFIGTNAAGTGKIFNSAHGIFIFRSPNNTIGGTVPGARNIISGNGNGFFTAPGIQIHEIQSTGNVVQGNFIGTDVTGTVDLGNTHVGVLIVRAPGNTIGGTTAGARNVISGNNTRGVEIQGAAATGNVVQGNFIGTDVTGTADLGNSEAGIFLFAPNNTIGGTVAGAGNVISGNNFFAGVGIITAGPSFPATGNVVQGNFIGTDATGTVDLGNSGFGVWLVGAVGNIIGGTALGARNVISGNDFRGIQIHGGGAPGNQVQGNFIGTDVTGTLDVGNSAEGVFLFFASGNTIGGTTPAARNVISGNNGDGVEIEGSDTGATGNQVQGNFIGTQADGTSPLGNSFHGVLIRVGFGTPGNAIGGTASGAGNAIAFNGGDGVFVESSTGNAIRRNSIFSNSGLGIDLGTNGVTLNDAGDGDTGANKLQNFPIVTSGTSGGGSTTVQGTLNSTPNTTFALEFFSNAFCDPSNFGEGQNSIGSGAVTTDGTGNASFAFNFPIEVALPQFITATATDPSGNTSEFSNCGPAADLSATKSDSPDPLAVGQTLTYTVAVANSGPANATAVTLTDTLPSSVTFVSATSTQGTCVEASGTVICSVGTLANGASATVTITVRPRIGVTITNTASVTGNEPDLNPTNNTASASTEVLGPPAEPPGCSPPEGLPPVCP